MAKRFFKSDMSVDGLNALADELNHYADVILQERIETAVSRLIDKGMSVARLNMGYVSGEGNWSGCVALEKKLDPEQYQCWGILIMSDKFKIISEWDKFGTIEQAEVSPTLMYEFGSGQYAVDGHRGTFPGQTHAFENKWSWKDLEGNWHTSSGIKPTQPLFHAAEQIYEDAIAVFREVFANE